MVMVKDLNMDLVNQLLNELESLTNDEVKLHVAQIVSSYVPTTNRG